MVDLIQIPDGSVVWGADMRLNLNRLGEAADGAKQDASDALDEAESRYKTPSGRIVATADQANGSLDTLILNWLKSIFSTREERQVNAREVGFVPGSPRAAFNSILSGLSALGGGELYVPAGDYVLDGQLGGTSLRNISIKLSPAATMRMGNEISARLGYFRDAKNLMIDGGRWDGGQGSANLAKRDGGILLDSCNNANVRNAVFSNVGQPVRITAENGPSADIYVHHNDFEGTIRDHACRAVEGAPERIYFTENLVRGVLNGGANGETAAYRGGGRDHVVQNNMVLSSYDTGVMFASGSVNCRSINNTLRTTQVSLFMGNGAVFCKSTGDTFRSANDSAVHCYNPNSTSSSALAGHVITDFTVEFAAKCGIHIEAANRIRISQGMILDVGSKTVYADGRALRADERSGIAITTSLEGRASSRVTVTDVHIIDTQATKTMQHGVAITGLSQEYIVTKSVTVESAVVSEVLVTSPDTNSAGMSIEINGFRTLTSKQTSLPRYSTASRPAGGSSTPGMILDTTLGVPIYFRDGAWRRFDTNATV